MRKISIRCVRRVGTVQATVKAVNVQTSNIVFSKNVNGTSEAKVCDGGKGDLPSATEARDAAMKDAVRQVVWAVAPHEMDLDLELLEMTDGIAGEANKAALSKGLDFAKRGRIDRACEEWKPAAAAEPKSPALLLNAGVCLEIAQKFTDALSYYNKADRLVGDMGGSSTAALAKLPGDMGKMFENAADPDKITQKAIKRVKEMMRKKEELRKQVN
jgi:tetratricopeptide (TPR) repeat protein